MCEAMSLSEFFFLYLIPLGMLFLACSMLGSVVFLFVHLCRRNRLYENYPLEPCLEPDAVHNYELLQEGIEQGIEAIDSTESTVINLLDMLSWCLSELEIQKAEFSDVVQTNVEMREHLCLEVEKLQCEKAETRLGELQADLQHQMMQQEQNRIIRQHVDVIDRSRSSLQAAEHRIVDLDAQLKDLALQQLSDIDTQQKELELSEKSFIDLQTKLTEREQIVQQKDLELEKISQEFEVAEKRCNGLTLQLQAKSMSNEVSEFRILEQEAQLDRQQETLQHNVEALEEKSNALELSKKRISELQEMLEQKEVEVIDEKDTIRHLDKELDNIENERERLEKQNDDLNAQIKEHKELLCQRGVMFLEKSKSNALFGIRIHEQELELKHLEETLHHKDQQLEETSKSLAFAKQHVAELSAQIVEKKSMAEDATKYRIKEQELQNQLLENDQKLRTEQQNNVDLIEIQNSLSAENESLLEMCNSQKKQLQGTEASLQQRVDELHGLLLQESRSNAKLVAEVEHKTNLLYRTTEMFKAESSDLFCLSEDRHRLCESIDAIEKRNRLLDSSVAKSQTLVDDLKSELKSLKDSHEQSSGDVERLQAELENVVEMKQSTDASANACKGEIVALTKERDTLTEELLESASQRIASYGQMKEDQVALKQQMELMKQRVAVYDDVLSERDSLKQKLESVEAELAAHQQLLQERDDLAIELELVKVQVEANEAREQIVQQKDLELEKTLQELELAEKRCNDLTLQLQAKSMSDEVLQFQLDEQSNSLELSQKRIAELLGLIQQKEVEVVDEQDTIRHLDEQIESIADELQLQVEENDTLKPELNTALEAAKQQAAKYDTVLAKLSERESNLEAVKMEVASLETKLLKRDADVSDLLFQVAHAERNCLQLRSSLADETISKQALKEELEDSNSQCDVLRSNLSLGEAARNSLEQQISALRTELTSVEVAASSARRECAALADQLEVAELNAMKTLDNLHQNRVVELEGNEIQLKQHELTIERLRDELQSSRAESEDMRQQLKQAQESLRCAFERSPGSSGTQVGEQPTPLRQETAKKSLVDSRRGSRDENISLKANVRSAVSSKASKKKSNKTFSSLSDFELKKELDNGRLGSIFLAVHKVNAKEFILKKIFRRRMQKLGAEQQVLMEIDLMGRFRHPNIVRLLGSFEDQRFVYLVLAYANEATSLLAHQQYLLQQRLVFPLQDVAFLVEALSSALSYMHQHGFVHGQVTAENVLLSADGVPRLNGLGNAFSLSNAVSSPASSPGSVAFNAKRIPPSPELILGKPLSDKVDSWALGVLAFSLLSGRQPFTSSSGLVQKELVLKGVPEYPADLEQSACNLLQRLLAKDAAQRLPVDEIRLHPFIVQHQHQRQQ